MKTVPRILCIGGHDPTGGAGIQADIETTAALGARAITLVTAFTVQDSHNIVSVKAVEPAFFQQQLQTLVQDILPGAVKIGMVGALNLVPIIGRFLGGFRGPVVLDPVLAAGGGFNLGNAALHTAILQQLIPYSTLTTPNRAEARRLTGNHQPEAAAQALLRAGAGAVLLTGADEAEGGSVTNQLFTPDEPAQRFSWPRLPHSYHGSGCTLASACAARLALGDDLPTAVDAGQVYTWRSLDMAERPGGGQWLPDRRA